MKAVNGMIPETGMVNSMKMLYNDKHKCHSYVTDIEEYDAGDCTAFQKSSIITLVTEYSYPPK